MASFKERWNIKSNWQLVIIIVVFAINGTLAAYLSKPILAFFGITKTSVSGWIYYPLYIIIILPVYKILLVIIGSIFGQHSFFKKFVLSMLHNMKLGFISDLFKKKKDV